MTNISWRRDAKNILYNYPENLRYLKSLEQDLIFAQSPHREVRRRGGISDPTAVKGMMLDKGEIKALKEQLAAVGRLLERLDSARRDAKYKRLLLEMVYFRRSHSLYGADVYKRQVIAAAALAGGQRQLQIAVAARYCRHGIDRLCCQRSAAEISM